MILYGTIGCATLWLTMIHDLIQTLILFVKVADDKANGETEVDTEKEHTEQLPKVSETLSRDQTPPPVHDDGEILDENKPEPGTPERPGDKTKSEYLICWFQKLRTIIMPLVFVLKNVSVVCKQGFEFQTYWQLTV